jgi:hypothetical protein
LLKKLKDVNDEYPEKLLVARRRSFLKRMTEVGFGIGGDLKIIHAKPLVSPIRGTLLEIALVVAIAAEAGTMAYFYRSKLASFFDIFITAPRVEETAPPAAQSTPLERPAVQASPVPPPAVVSPAGITAAPTSTAIPAIVSSNTPGASPSGSTPVPKDNKGNHGNHYGQTPKPERTKENNGNHDKPPKEKPTKTK